MQKILKTATFVAALILSGCASQPVSTFETFQAQDLNGLLSSGQYVQKADNFFVINDSSSSMADEYLGAGYPAQPSPTKFSVEKEILNRINHTIPDLKLTSSIRSFGFGDCLSWGFTQLNQAPASYSKPVFGSGIDALTCASGGSPIASGIEGTTEDLSTTVGNIAVLILSDGHDLDSDGVNELQTLKQKYGDRLCVYSVWVGNQEEQSGITLLNQLANISGCGFGTTADRISSSGNMANFVKSIFLKTGTPIAADCSTLDSDADGVNDCIDKCPNTIPGAKVSILGCWIVDVKFDNNKADIKPEYFQNLDNAAKRIQEHPELLIEVQGHTSKTGSFQHNMKLSERRALAVKNYLINGTHSTNITSRGYGWTQPIDTNETEAGRANNRRVQLEVNGQAQQPLNPQ
ncbi:OmpA family protein [Methylobacter sp. S3L5C]|uniref:OmpA family protein n=1 Tax=Methylobacter sp. S3L5C TaxID=2839024 RepID=UPI001FAD0954|nr:OmpA family protein [Methylobacter sp. S3L5C]UOA08115.1 OmpA family protein [Methylobacter sp. S3L5C]